MIAVQIIQLNQKKENFGRGFIDMDSSEEVLGTDFAMDCVVSDTIFDDSFFIIISSAH